MKAIEIKSGLLGNGINISPKALKNYTLPYLEKRRAYGNPDPNIARHYRMPQELYILPDNLVVSVIFNKDSKWTLDYDDEFYITNGNIKNTVTFPIRPQFYDQKMKNGDNVSKIITLYGGSSLGIFVYGNCHMADINKACHYCSIKPNRSKVNEFENIIKPMQAYEAISLALEDKTIPITQVMINGGNLKYQNKNFSYYLSIVEQAEKAIKNSNMDIDLHLIASPPRDTYLLEDIRNYNLSIAINMEVFNKELFSKYVPGKNAIYGRDNILKSLEISSKLLGKNRVYSILVGGLEPIDSMYNGMIHLAELGVTPVINVLHIDPETPLEKHSRISPDFIMEMGSALQEIYSKYDLKPFYEGCGRNSIDTEAYYKLFD